MHLGIIRHLLEIKRAMRMDRAGLEAWQGRKMERLLDAASRTDYYSGFMGRSAIRRGVDGLESLPILKRETLRGGTRGLYCRHYARGKVGKVATSGSSGNPVEVCVDEGNLAWRIASGFAVTTEFGRSPRDLLVEITARPHAQSPLLALSGMYRSASLSVFDSEEHNYSRIRQMGADILGRHPSTMRLISDINERSPSPISLKAVYCTGETLSAPDRKAISSSFGCPVFDHYGTTETGSVAFECPEEHRLHVHPSCIVEIVSDSGKPVRSGSGEMLVTSLENLAMPLLRYEAGDRASWGGECGCGRALPVLSEIEGRSVDLILLPSGKRIATRFLDILANIRGIPRHQVIQKSEGLIVFRHASEGELPQEVRTAIKAVIAQGCRNENVAVEFERVSGIRAQRSGKTPLFVPIGRHNHL